MAKVNLAKAGLVIGSMAVAASGYYWVNKDRLLPISSYEVLRVLDGDTFETKERQLIRLASVEAPEVDNCGGVDAKNELEKLVLDKPVQLKVLYRDRFNRLIAWVWAAGVFVNERMVGSGEAVYQLTEKSSDESKILKTASAEARSRRMGLYGGKCSETTNPDNKNCDIKANIRPGAGKEEKFYHTRSCAHYERTGVNLYEGDRWFCTEEEAVAAGFVKAGLCK